MAKRVYGWVPDVPDHRDLAYAAPVAPTVPMPAKVDLSATLPEAYDQKDLGSCTANAIAGAHQFDQIKQKLVPVFMPSRLFIYYNERVMEGTTESDSGAQIRDGIKSIARQGVCPEPMWPYVIAQFTVKPSEACYAEACKHRAVRYYRVPRSLGQLKGCLAEGYPYVFGFSVYESFESQEVKDTGVVPMPGANEALLGGHAVLAVGYDDAQQRFLVRNSWGPDWGLKGHFTMPYAYLLDGNLSDDFWTVRQVN